MREILFRGKNDRGEWIVGFYIKDAIETYIYDKHRNTRMQSVAPETVGQYTGLDKNGTKIFEGDVGRYKQTDGVKENGKPIICTGKVIYNEKTASYAVESKDEKGRKYFDYFPINDFEIIGNIHDNPELLEGGVK